MRSIPQRLTSLCLLMLWLTPFAAVTELEVITDTGDAIPVKVYPAAGESLVLWLPGEYGLSPRQAPTAEALTAQGIEVWMPDLHTAWFIAPGRYSLLEVPPQAIADLIGRAASRTGKRLYVMAAGRSAALALTAVRAWQAGSADPRRLGGVVLLHPNLYRRTPQGGESAEYLPIARSSQVPVYLLQPEHSAAYWRVGELVRELEAGGASVFLHRLEGVSDGFNTRPDFTPEDEALAARLPGLVAQALGLLATTEGIAVATEAKPEVLAAPERDRRTELLRPYAKPRAAPPLRLIDRHGAKRDLEELEGHVVLVNFWATWCPPCVEEIPSLQRLFDSLRPEGLEVVTVDVGETAEQVAAFLEDKPVTFPVLLDPQGAAFKAWDAYAFPTTLVLDRRQRIRYAVFGAFAWDSTEVIETLRTLLNEPSPAT